MRDRTIAHPQGESLLASHTVLRNTYMLLSMTLLFSALMAWTAMSINAAPMGILVSLVGMFGLLFLTMFLRNSAWGILSVFAFTGFIGYMIGPMLNMYIHTFSNGGELVMMSLGTTGLAFFGLSAYAITTKKNMSYMGGFLFVGLLVAIIGSFANMFFHLTALSLAISGMTVFIACGLILYDTSRIIHNGETNYIMATISLYLDLYMLFMHLLNLLAALNGRQN